MSSGYAKLFGSILASTVWQAADHVRLVWITMLAMKDRDGVVEAAIPGLAHHARVSVAQCEEAITAFLSPDPYSRTPDNEGRRIEAVDGGWRLLNNDKYRERLDAKDQKAKAAARQKRLRDRRRPLRNVTRNGVASRIRQAESETETEEEDPELEPVDPDEHPIATLSRPEPPAAQSPDPLPGGPSSRPDQDLLAPLARTAAHVAAVGAVTKELLAELNTLRVQVAAEHRLADVWPVAIDDLGLLRRRLRDDPEGVAAAAVKARHVLAVAAAEARATRSVQWLGGQLFGDKSWSRALRMTPGDAKRSATRQREAGDAPRYRIKAREEAEDAPPPLGLHVVKDGTP